MKVFSLKSLIIFCFGLGGGLFSAKFVKAIMQQRFVKSIEDFRQEQLSAGAYEKLNKLPFTEQILNFRQFTLPLNNPEVVAAREADHMVGEDLVIGVQLGSAYRAYPWWVLANYHVVTDFLNGTPIVVTLCEACGATAAFDTRVKGMTAPLDFSSANVGVGFGTFLMADSATGSIWHPFVGTAVRGKLKGTRLVRINSQVASWNNWRRTYPGSDVVLAGKGMRLREHGMLGAREVGQPGLSGLLATVANMKDKRLPLHKVVFGLIASKGAVDLGQSQAKGKAYPLDLFNEKNPILRDRYAGEDIVIVRTARFGARAFKTKLDGQPLELNIDSQNPVVLVDQSGNRFDEWGYEIDRQTGVRGLKRLSVLNGYVTEWYEWSSSFPKSEIFSSAKDAEKRSPTKPL